MGQEEQPLLASDGLPVREAGPWALDKKFYLERYLEIVTKGVGPKWNGKLSYIDLFAGPGLCVIRDSGTEVDGSPLTALRFDFAHYVFVDTPDVIATLRKRISRHPKASTVALIEGDCNQVIETVRESSPADHLAVAFVDPTGLQIRFETLRRLVQNRKIDLLMTIQLGMGITMNLPQYAQSNGETLTNFLGNNHWRLDLDEGGSISQTSNRIVKRYLRQLKELGYETAEGLEIPVRTSPNNLLLYFIVLASRHPRGRDFWNKITKIGPSGQRKLF